MERQPTSSNPSDDAIDAIIQQATSAAPYSRPGASGPLRDTRTQLFVGNLPYRVRWQDLKDLFRKAGTVLRADVSLGPDNRSRGYGTVLLATAEDAGRAVDTFNGYSWQSRILEVRLDRQLQEFDSPTPSNSSYLSLLFSASKSSSVTDDSDHPPSVTDPNSRRNLFVGNLPFHCQWQDLKDLFRQAGTIMRADIVLGPDGRSRGFGSVVFATELDAERALKMFNGYDFNGRVLNVHRDKYSFSNQPENTSTSPIPGSSSGASSHPTHITLPPGYMFDLLPSSAPASPHEMFKYQHHQHQHQHDQQQLHLQLQQHQHCPQHHQHHKHQQQQQRNHLYDKLDYKNLPDTSPSTLRSGASSTQFHEFIPPSSSRPPSTSAPISTKHPIPIPIYKPPSLSHTNTASSGSDRSEMFSRLSSTSATSAASSVSSLVSRSHSQGSVYSHGQVLGQGQRARGQPFQTSSPHPVSSPEPSHHSHSGLQHHSSSSSHSSSPRASQLSSSYATSTCHSLSRPPSSNPNHRPPQRPGPISLPPPLLPSQIAFNYPLQQLSPHVYTPLGMSVSVSVSPLVEYPGGFGYANGMYGQQQQQQFGQHMTPNGLPMTPSMPPFFLPPNMASGSHATPTGASMRVGTGGGSSSSGGHRRTHSRSKSLARHLEGELGSIGENTRSNANVSANERTSSPSLSPPPSSSTRQRHHHQQHHHHHQNQQPSHHQNAPPRRSAAGVDSGSNAQPIPNASNVSTIPQSQLQPMSMHINLNSIPGAFSPGVVMSPGTFYGRPGEVPTFINAAVGAPLAMRGGGGADTSEEGSGMQIQTQQGQGQAGQWYHQNQTHGSYFYAMSSPRRGTPTGMEPKGYFDPLFFPAGVNACDDSGGGYSSSVGGSGALVNEIMKDGRAESLGVEMGKEDGRGKARGRKGEGEEETHISDDDGDDERDSGDDADDDDDSGEQAEEGENLEAHDTGVL